MSELFPRPVNVVTYAAATCALSGTCQWDDEGSAPTDEAAMAESALDPDSYWKDGPRAGVCALVAPMLVVDALLENPHLIACGMAEQPLLVPASANWLPAALGVTSVTVDDETIPPGSALFHFDGRGYLFTAVLGKR